MGRVYINKQTPVYTEWEGQASGGSQEWENLTKESTSPTYLGIEDTKEFD